jgi:S-DNA-T family DNA segregation ATPase FtsK/SpoIIIE
VATTRRAPAKRRPAAKKKKPPSLLARFRTLLSTHLGRQSDDVWGLLLILGGLLAGLGIYFDLTGLLGRWMREGASLTIGLGRLLLPVALIAVGGTLVRGRARNAEPGRVAIGFGFLLFAFTGLCHLLFYGDAAEVRDAGGWLGRLVGQPLSALLATWGASLVFLTLLGIGALILTGTSVRAASDSIHAGAAASGRMVRKGIGWLGTVGKNDELDQAEQRHPASQPVKRTRKKPEPVEPAAEADVAPQPEPQAPEPVETETPQLAINLGPGATPSPWRLPPLQILKKTASQEIDQREIDNRGRILEESLAAHGVETRLVGKTVGPTVTRYELELGLGVKVARVTALHKDIAYALAAEDVRILAPIPGRSAIGVEVPNAKRHLVSLGDILTSNEAKLATHPLDVGLGRDIAGRAVIESLASMPHVLIAGATGAGKSSCINSIITSILTRTTPDQVRMILVDPKRVELGQYEGVPHLLTSVVINPKKAANALAWAVAEMDRRSDLLAEVGFRDITGYNAAFDRGELEPKIGEPENKYERLPFIVCVVDELNDLMMVAARDVEDSICRIAQMGRAFGIHLVIATQRPSVNVITGVIKANVPTRMAFKVSSLTDSRVILDQPGAERLVGKGDMLLLTATSSVARRIQGPWVGEDEVRKVVAHWKRQQRPAEQPEIQLEGEEQEGFASTLSSALGAANDDIAEFASPSSGDDDDETLVNQAMELIVRSQLGSTSMLQRKLRVGFARAGRLMDELEQRGIVGPSEGSKPRAVLMTVDELEAQRQNR